MSDRCAYPHGECPAPSLGAQWGLCYTHAMQAADDQLELGIKMCGPMAMAFCLPIMVSPAGWVVVLVTLALSWSALALAVYACSQSIAARRRREWQRRP